MSSGAQIRLRLEKSCVVHPARPSGTMRGRQCTTVQLVSSLRLRSWCQWDVVAPLVGNTDAQVPQSIPCALATKTHKTYGWTVGINFLESYFQV